jgi:hypothetical protein
VSWQRLDRTARAPVGSARAGARDATVVCTLLPSAGHIDDVDVLLVQLRGSKRFRVAGRAAGSAVVVDHLLNVGDALYIPALYFHTGGDSSSASSDAPPSTMLSVAMPPASETDASHAVGEWRRARGRRCTAANPRARRCVCRRSRRRLRQCAVRCVCRCSTPPTTDGGGQ